MVDLFPITEPTNSATILKWPKHKRDPATHEIFGGNLFSCCVCGGAEGSLPTHCPGSRMTHWREDNVMNGTLDYVKGEWVFK